MASECNGTIPNISRMFRSRLSKIQFGHVKLPEMMRAVEAILIGDTR